MKTRRRNICGFLKAKVLRIGLDVPHVRQKFCLDSRKGKENGSFADQQIEAAYEPLEAALEKIRGSLRRSIKRFFSGLTERPVHGALVRTGAKALDLVFKALVCRFVGDQTNRFDIVEDVFVPLFQALLKAQNDTRYLQAWMEHMKAAQLIEGMEKMMVCGGGDTKTSCLTLTDAGWEVTTTLLEER